MANGARFSFTFQSRGTIPYHCARHPSMVGTIIVQ
jgi:plastocyanin